MTPSVSVTSSLDFERLVEPQLGGALARCAGEAFALGTNREGFSSQPLGRKRVERGRMARSANGFKLASSQHRQRGVPSCSCW